jgi:hypothetical protein
MIKYWYSKVEERSVRRPNKQDFVQLKQSEIKKKL